MILLVKGEDLGGKALTVPICASSSLTLSLPDRILTVPFVILLCLTPDDFTHQWRASGWERVKGPTEKRGFWILDSWVMEKSSLYENI